MTKNRVLIGAGPVALNPRVFDVTNGVFQDPTSMSVAVKQAIQDKYSTNVKGAYNAHPGNPILPWLRKGEMDGHGRYIDYKTGKVTTRKRDVNAYYDNENHVPKKAKGQDTSNFIESRVGVVEGYECPVYWARDQMNWTQLQPNSALTKAGVDATWKTHREQSMTLFKEFIGGGYKASYIEGTTTKTKALAVAAANKFGDKTKGLEEGVNKFKFTTFVNKMKNHGNQGEYPPCMLMGIEAQSFLATSPRFSQSMNAAKATVDGRSFEQLLTVPVVTMAEYDSIVDTHATEGKIVGFLKDSVSYLADGGIRTTMDYLTEKKHWYFDTEMDFGFMILDEDGIFLFEYDKTRMDGLYNQAIQVPETPTV